MNPYVQIAIGVATTLLIALVMFAVGRRFLTQDRAQDRQSGSDKEIKEDSREATEKLASQLAENVETQARNVELDRKAELARVETDRKEAAIIVKAEQSKLVTRVDDLERDTQKDMASMRTVQAVFKERLNNIAEWLRAKLGRTRINGD